MKGYNPHILSFGEKRFQLAKINPLIPILQGSGTLIPLEVTAVDRRKGEHIAELHEGQRSALVDDIPDQQLPKSFTEIRIDRTRNLLESIARSNVFIVSSLAQARCVIESLSQAV